jgi:hypothetical protein
MKGVTDKTVNEIRREMRRWGGVNMTPSQVRKYLAASPKLESRLTDYGPGLDTVERESFLDLMAYVVGGSAFWPRNAQGKAFLNRFLDRFHDRCREAGIEVEPMDSRKRKRPRPTEREAAK